MGLKEELLEAIISAGAVAVGFADADDLPPSVCGEYADWIGEGHHAGMEYLARHSPLKMHPRHVMDDAVSVVSMAFSYAPAGCRDRELPMIARYAWGEDYHDVVRRRLGPVVEHMKARHGGNWRICVDTAPLPERYWAMRAGIGTRGENGSVIVDNYGSWCFLAEILSSLHIAPDAPSEAFCAGCGACRRACPTGALLGNGRIDSRRCLNYLTIEHRGPWKGEMLATMRSDAGRATLYGCDICQQVCPHNKDATPTAIAEFMPLERIIRLDAETVAAMTGPEFSSFFKGSAMKRARLDGLSRNAENILRNMNEQESALLDL